MYEQGAFGGGGANGGGEVVEGEYVEVDDDCHAENQEENVNE